MAQAMVAPVAVQNVLHAMVSGLINAMNVLKEDILMGHNVSSVTHHVPNVQDLVIINAQLAIQDMLYLVAFVLMKADVQVHHLFLITILKSVILRAHLVLLLYGQTIATHHVLLQVFRHLMVSVNVS